MAKNPQNEKPSTSQSTNGAAEPVPSSFGGAKPKPRGDEKPSKRRDADTRG